MSKVNQSDFLSRHARSAIDLRKLANSREARAKLDQGRLSSEQLRQADRNRDGMLDASEAWVLADRFDRDGSTRSLVARDAGGAETQAGMALGTLASLLATRSLQATSPLSAARPSYGRDDILYVGMNNPSYDSAGASYEVQQLRGTGARVHAVTDARVPDRIQVGDTAFDLTRPGDREAFARTLGLREDQARRVADAIGRAGPDARDELAGVARVWAAAERGEPIPSRMVLSGHHAGSALWGEQNGSLTWQALQDLARVMPRAAARVEDLHVAGCYSGGEAKWDQYRGIFPNLKTAWAHTLSAPGAGSGATEHMRAWEQATRGGSTEVQGAMERLRQRGVRKSEYVTVWSHVASARTGTSLDELRQRVRIGEERFAGWFRGEDPPGDPYRGPLRSYYNDVQALLQHRDLPLSERSSWEWRRDQAIRLLFYDRVAARFQQVHHSQVQAGYRALGLAVPDFGRLPRAQAIEAIQRFGDALARVGDPPPSARELLPLLEGLRALDRRVVPENWM